MDVALSIVNKPSINRIVAQIEGWMSTYFLAPYDGSGGIGGLIATYWASSPYVAGPYIMNPYGLIRGLCARALDDRTGEGRRRAENLALYYLRCQDPTTGLFICAWGEDPFSGNGLVQQSSVVAALWDLQAIWPNREVEKAAQRCWRACLHHHTLLPSWTVINQALRGCEALMVGIKARGDKRPNAAEARLLGRVGRQVADGQWGGNGGPAAGAMAQAFPNDDIIMPYQGKCLSPLVLLAKTLDAPLYLDIAKRLADFILHNMETDKETRLLHGQYIAEGPELRKARRLYRARRLIPMLEPYLRRYRQRKITIWRFNPFPQWLARGLDTARGFYHLGCATGEQHFTRVALEMLQETLKFQSPLGGIRNTRGFFGEDPELVGLVWQDMTPIPRWNSYAVQFLHELAVGTPLIKPITPDPAVIDEVKLAGNSRLIETTRELQLVDARGVSKWKVIKGQRWGRPCRSVTKGEGGAATGRRVLPAC